MFNREAFLEDVKRIHSLTDELVNIDVRRELDNFIDYDELLFSKALDDICNNVVGKTMFMLLIAKKSPGMSLRIIDIGPEQSRTKALLVNQKGSSYGGYDVWINLNLYDRNGIGIPERQYYCIDEGGNVTLKPKSLAASIFHEFVHCLHDVEDWRMYDRERHSPVPEPWTNEEERRTISGYIDPGIFDPICDNCFHLYDSVVSERPYLPRIGHCDYRSDTLPKAEQKRRNKLQQLCNSCNFDLAWPKQYILS
jgi:hypothetical protein